MSSQSKIKIATSDDNILESVNSNSVLGVVDKEDKSVEEVPSSGYQAWEDSQVPG